jgi:hypothetical protein
VKLAPEAYRDVNSHILLSQHKIAECDCGRGA